MGRRILPEALFPYPPYPTPPWTIQNMYLFQSKLCVHKFQTSFTEENMNAAQRQRIIRSGWLKKQGGMVRTWHRRWFCLNNDFLFYFAKEDDSRPLGCIFLPGNRVSEVPFNPDEPDKCLLEISAGNGQNHSLLKPLSLFL